MRQGIYNEISIRCYAALNDFLPVINRQVPFMHQVKLPATIEEVLQSLGIPLSEVDLVLHNSHPAALNHKLSEGDYLSVYPVFEQLDPGSITLHSELNATELKFILDAHLGKLAKYLRMLGFDALYRNDFGDDEIIDIAKKEARFILTRDKLLLNSKSVNHGYFVRATEKQAQVEEVLLKFNLQTRFKAFTRCVLCNSKLVEKSPKDVLHLIEPKTASVFNAFYYCPDCRKVYWKGSHYERMKLLIECLSGNTDTG